MTRVLIDFSIFWDYFDWSVLSDVWTFMYRLYTGPG